jgi:two-component system response regulator YesN
MYQLMIVDDDIIIRRGLSQAIPWEEYGIGIAGVAGDGQTALQMMENKVPDIVIADIRMPRVDGLEFAKLVRAKYPEVKVILLTAYKDFEYAKTALQLQVCDYLLKPVDNQALLEVVNRAVLAKAEQHKINRKLEESTPLLLQQFLLGLIEERYSPSEIRTKLELLELETLEPPLVVVVIKVDDYYQTNERVVKKEVLKSAVSGIVIELTQAAKGLEIDSGQDELVVLYPAGAHPAEQLLTEANQWAETIRQTVLQRLKTTVTIGIGKIAKSLSEIGRSYADACSVLEIRHILGKNQVFFGPDLPMTSENVTVDVYPIARKLLQQLKLGLLEEALTLVNRVEQQIRAERCLALDHLQMIGMELAVLLFAEVKEWPEIGAKISQKYDSYQFNFAIKQAQTVTEVFDRLREVIREICTAVNTLRKSLQHNLITQAIGYITANYNKTDLSLHDVAAQIHLSPTYLSNTFKKEQGINFSDFILELRMKKAMELLRGSDFKVYEVAELVGYNNVHYFSACFKKYTNGISPTDFKNS